MADPRGRRSGSMQSRCWRKAATEEAHGRPEELVRGERWSGREVCGRGGRRRGE